MRPLEGWPWARIKTRMGMWNHLCSNCLLWEVCVCVCVCVCVMTMCLLSPAQLCFISLIEVWPIINIPLFTSRLNYKKQVQKFENFDNNNPATTYGATAATGTSTDVQASRTGSRQIIYDRRREQEPLVFSRPRPPMQQQNQNRLPGDQVTGL